MSRTIPSLSVHPARIDKGAWGGAETGKLLGLKLVIVGPLQGAVPPVAQAPMAVNVCPRRLAALGKLDG